MKPVSLRWLLVAVLVAACGSAASPGSTPEPAGDQAGQNPPAEAPAPGAGGIVVPTIADALYTTGTAHVEVSGQRTLTTDAALVPGASMTTGGTTLLMFGAGEGQEAVIVSISNGPDTGLAMTITAPEVITGGDGSTGCGFEVTRNDDTGLDGTFSCRGLSTVGLELATVDVNGSFSADR